MRTVLTMLVFTLPLAAQTSRPTSRPVTKPAEKAAAATNATESGLEARLRELAAAGPITVAHRGASGKAPENTVPAFEAAVRAGSHMVELDFRQTADGYLVCFHDSTLDRTTDSVARLKKEKVKLEACSMAQLRDLDAGTWKDERYRRTRIPTLDAALRAIQLGSVTMIEHKSGDAERLVKLLRKRKLVDDVLVQSFDWEWLAEVHALEPKLMLAALGGTKKVPSPTDAVLAEIEKTGARMVHWNHKRLTAEDVQRLHAKGYLVCVYTVNAQQDIDRVTQWGVDAITTDFPERRTRAPVQDERARK